MTAIGKGDFVEAVKDSNGELGPIFRKGEVLRVVDLVDVADLRLRCGDCGELAIVGVVVPVHPPGYASCPCCFKPVSGGQPGMFTDLLKVPTDAPLEPVAA